MQLHKGSPGSAQYNYTLKTGTPVETVDSILNFLRRVSHPTALAHDNILQQNSMSVQVIPINSYHLLTALYHITLIGI